MTLVRKLVRRISALNLRRSSWWVKLAVLASLAVVVGGGTLFYVNSTRAATPYIIAAFGDYGCQPGSSCTGIASQKQQPVADLVASWNADAIITLGDNSYEYGCAAGAPFPQATANNCSGTNDIQADQAPYNQPGGPIQSGIFYPTFGNHDDNFNWNNYLYGGSATCTSATVESDVSNCAYIYDRPPHYVAHLGNGLVDFFATNSNGHDPGGNQTGGTQSTWYNNKVAASTATWKLEGHHHPRWSSGEHGSNTYVDWTVNNSIDLFLAGHDHNSEHLVKNGKNYVIEGTGGRNVRTGTTCIPETNSTGVTYGAGGTTIVDTSKGWDKDKLAGRTVTVAGQTRTIVSNTSTIMTVDTAFSPVPAGGSQYTTSNCVVGSKWQDDTHFGAVKLSVTTTQLKTEYYATDGSMLYRFSIYKGVSTGSASGTITSNGVPVANAKVSYSDGDTYTDASGNYSFDQLPTGTVLLSVTASGYQNTSQTITVNSGANTVQNFSLTSSGIIFASGFETNTTGEWSLASANVAVCANGVSCPVNSGNYAIEANTATGPGYVQKNTGSTYNDLNTRMYFYVKSRSTNVSMIYDRTASSGGIFHLLMDTGNKIVLRNDAKATTTNSCTTVANALNQWHQLETNISIPGSGNSTVTAWLDGNLVTWAGTDAVCGTGDDTTSTSQDFTNAGVQPSVGQLIIGDTASTGRTFDMLMDDGAFSSTGYIGSVYGNINGQVTQFEGGAALSGATVTAAWTYPGTSSSGTATATADASGNYSFASTNCLTNHTGCVPGNLNIRLTAAATGFSDSPTNTSFLTFNGTLTGKDFALSAASGVMNGTVTDATTGAPISGASVSNAEGIVTTDASGFYSQFLEPEQFLVTASHADYQSANATVQVISDSTVTQNFALTPLPGTISGTVTDATTAAPLAGVTISYSGGSTTTDGSGNYTLSNIPAETAYTITASLTNYAGATTNVNFVPAGSMTYTFNLAPNAGTISGTVKDATTSANLSGVTVSYSGGSTTTNGSGVYSFSNVPAGVAQTLTFSLVNYAGTTSNVTLAAGATATRNANLSPNAGTVTGNVQSGGSNLSGVTVSYSGGSATTDASGNYSLSNVPAEVAYTLTATKTGYGNQTAAVNLSPGGSMVRNFTMTLLPDNPPQVTLTVSPKTDITPFTIQASAAGSTDGDITPIATYRFDFGDGAIVGPQAGATAVHSYAAAGTYTVSVTVTDTASLSSTAAVSVTISVPAQSSGSTVVNVSPVTPKPTASPVASAPPEPSTSPVVSVTPTATPTATPKTETTTPGGTAEPTDEGVFAQLAKLIVENWPVAGGIGFFLLAGIGVALPVRVWLRRRGPLG